MMKSCGSCGISRVSFLMDVAALPNRKTLQAIELIRTRVSPLVKRKTMVYPQ